MKACMKTKGKFSAICEEKFHSPAKELNIKRNTRWPKQKTVSTWAYVPLESSLYHACTTALACFLWCINHSESVWTLCWVFERSLNFFSSVDVEKEVIFNTFYINNKQKQRKFTTNGGQRNWELNCLDLTQSPLTSTDMAKKKPRYSCSAEHFLDERYAYIFCKTAVLKLEDSITSTTWRITRFIEHWSCTYAIHLTNRTFGNSLTFRIVWGLFFFNFVYSMISLGTSHQTSFI